MSVGSPNVSIFLAVLSLLFCPFQYQLFILGMISAFRDFGHSDAEIKTALIKYYNLSGNDAQRFLAETK